MKKNAETRKGTTAYWKETPAKRKGMAVLISLAGTWAFPWMIHQSGSVLDYTNSVLAVFVFLILFLLFDKILQVDLPKGKGGWLFPGLVGGGFSVCMVFGVQLDLKGNVPFGKSSMWISILVLSVLFSWIVRYSWERLKESTLGLALRREAEKNVTAEGMEKGAGQKRGEKAKSILIRASVILLCYLPVFLAVYPGFFVYDAQDEYLQVVTRNFSTHHPLLHVLLLGGIIQLVWKLTGSYNLGIACYTLFQMAVMSVIFAWCVEKLKNRGMGRTGRTLLTLYFGLCPVLVMFSLCSAKDGLFTGMLLIMVLLLQELFENGEAFFEKKGTVILFGISSLGMMLLRHNGFYAFLVFAAFSVWYLLAIDRRKKKENQDAARNAERKPCGFQALLLFGGILVSYLLVSTALTGILRADHSENQEMLTVPISQMARVYSDEKEGLPEAEKEILYRYLPKEALNRYTPKVTDGVKIDFNNTAFAQDKGSFLRLWASWGLHHPFTYLNAWFMTSYGYWYPDTVIDVYRGNSVFTFTYKDSSYFGYEVEEPGNRESKLPRLNELYRKLSLEIFQQKVPVVSMLFSPGFLFWVMSYLIGYFCYRKRWKKVMPYLLPLLIFMTLLLGPTYLVRYVVFLWVMVPLLVWEVICNSSAPLHS